VSEYTVHCTEDSDLATFTSIHKFFANSSFEIKVVELEKNLPEESFYLELFQLPGGHPEK